jgi:hypothetical protein
MSGGKFVFMTRSLLKMLGLIFFIQIYIFFCKTFFEKIFTLKRRFVMFEALKHSS